MRKFVATSGAEVIGSAMNNWFVSVHKDEYLPLIQPMLSKYGISEIEADKWYPHQYSLDVFKLIADAKSNSMSNLVALGIAYVETATFPPEINNTFSALTLLPVVYHLNVRNVPDSEGYEVTQISDKHIQIKDVNPFPHDTVYGFVWGIAKRFKMKDDSHATVKRTFFNPADPDADGALYDVTVD